ncbi:hypothetical protein ACFUC1_14280 [Pedococcus sp. NPDC057267]|uniref:hypothetical protein n=1 Tax=Pedococcus sp. NPDC057267 TaxID=3346077 RepID=UPI003645C434
MSTTLGQQLAELVGDVDTGRGPDTADLWSAGRRRRRWSNLRTTAGMAAVAVLVALVLAPGTWQDSAVPAGPGPGHERTHPSVIPQPHFASSLLEAHRPMTAAFLDDQSVYAVDDTGRSWRAPSAPGRRSSVAISPDGRYLSDGWSVFDAVGGTARRLEAVAGVPSDRRGATAWSPDSRHVAVLSDSLDGTSTHVLVCGPDGAALDTPVLPAGVDQRLFPTPVTWLGPDRLLALVEAPPQAADPEVKRLLAFTWAVGTGTWDPFGTLTLPRGASLDYLATTAVSVSPGGRTLALAVDVEDGSRGGSTVLTWSVASLADAAAVPDRTIPPDTAVVEGISWRGEALVVSRAGETRVAASRELLSSSGSGSGRPISWRAGAFDDPAYYNTAAVWQDRLFVWAVLLAILTFAVVLMRAARPLAARAGLLGERYASPFPIEARWLFSAHMR